MLIAINREISKLSFSYERPALTVYHDVVIVKIIAAYVFWWTGHKYWFYIAGSLRIAVWTVEVVLTGVTLHSVKIVIGICDSEEWRA